ncbi:MAG: hypothetical protein OXH13_00745 [Chloroflexi bacterium]|nr:hypothetical protein [Chloroflexota bacterium]MCY3697163.1 hypothetical protein [Chloroflexota bacterium]MXX81418.1 hypothetical protein [Chloroflexota bacterium]MYB22952.1 hypothetical protein [Chloroflexota bacterium]MYF22920.1 hypothetical protein [Chloroflexota bacterium]
MPLELLDPTGEPAPTGFRAAPRLTALDSLRIGLFSNGKVNADRLLRYTAEVFEREAGCRVAVDTGKPNASRIAEPQVLERIANDVDFLITAVGD